MNSHRQRQPQSTSVGASALTLNQLEHLRLVFPDRSLMELQQVLLQHDNDVQRAAEALLNEPPAASPQSADLAISPTVVALPPMPSEPPPPPPTTDNASLDFWNTTTGTSAQPTMAVIPPSINNDPTNSTQVTVNTTASRQRRLMEAQQAVLLQQQQEEAQLNEALRSSLAPTNRGIEYLSDDQLAELMSDPVFLASLDQDLKQAVLLQAKLEAAEQEYQEWNQQQNQRQQKANNSRPRSAEEFLSSLSNNLAKRTDFVKNLQQRKELQQLGAQFVKARSTFGIATNEEMELIQQLERMNMENEQEQQRRAIRLQAKELMMQAVQDHLDSFLEEHPDASYEEWIQDLHPENTYEDAVLLEGLDDSGKAKRAIDHRFYVEESDHRQLWNERCQQDMLKATSSTDSTASSTHDPASPARAPTTSHGTVTSSPSCHRIPVAAIDDRNVQIVDLLS